jgi:hypothetical protein
MFPLEHFIDFKCRHSQRRLESIDAGFMLHVSYTMPLCCVHDLLQKSIDQYFILVRVDSHDVATRRHDPSIAAAPVATSLTG